MSRSFRKALGRVAAVSIAAVGLSACDITLGAHQYQVREEKKFAVAGAARVNLATFDGSVEIRGWDRPEVLIEIEKHGPDQATTDAIKVTATQVGGVITIDIPRPAGLAANHSWHTSPGASIVASVPLKSDLIVRSGDGSVSIRRVDGSHDIKTEDGSIKIDGMKGTLLARTGDGSVRGEDVDGSVDIETGDGSITVDGTVTGVRLETNDGSVQLKARQGSVMAGDWSITTGDGSLRAEFPKGFSANVDAESGDGRVYVEGLTKETERDSSEARDDRRERRRAQGPIGGGGKILRLRSGDGSISVQVW